MYCKVQSSITVTDHKNLCVAIKVDGTSSFPGVRVWPVQANVATALFITLYKIEHASTHGFTNPACT